MKDRYIGLLGVLLSVFLFFDIKDMQFKTKVFPIACLVALCALSVALVLRRDGKKYEFKEFKRISISIAIILAYMFCMNVIGFLVSTIAFMLAFSFYNKHNIKTWIVVVYSVLYPSAIYLLFKVVLMIRLPQGLLI